MTKYKTIHERAIEWSIMTFYAFKRNLQRIDYERIAREQQSIDLAIIEDVLLKEGGMVDVYAKIKERILENDPE